MKALEPVARLLRRLPPWLLPVLFVVFLLTVPFTQTERIVQLTILFGINALLGQSINLLTGYTGQISLGHAALYGAGAYTTAVLGVRLDWPLWATIPSGVVVAMVLGLVVSFPAGRVREFYLAMVTLGLGLLAAEVLAQWTSVTGGFSGLANVPSSVLDSLVVFDHPLNLVEYYYVVLAGVVLLTWLLSNVLKSHVGRSFVAISQSEVAASTFGVPPGRRKRLAYVLSAALAGIAGVLYAHLVGFLSPDAFAVTASVAILVFAVLGGTRTLAGPFLGAALLTFLPDQLQVFREHQLLVYGCILLFSFLVLPRGIAGLLPYRTPLLRVPADVPEVPDEPSAPAPPVEVHDLAKRFGGVRALDGVSVTAQAGTIHGLIGPNGSGKTTLLNVVSGVYRPSGGSVAVGGDRVDGRSPQALARLGVCRTFQHPILVDELTVEENVVVGAERLYRTGLFGAMLRLPRAVAEERRLVAAAVRAVERVGLTEQRGQLVGGLPFGRKRMVELARALVAQPRVLMLDEPAAGLAEEDLEALAVLLRDLRDSGITVILIEHHMDFLLDLVDSVTVLDYGRVIFDGSPRDVRRDERVLAAYLGSAAVTSVAGEEV